MILAPVVPVTGQAFDTPIGVRLIGVLDRVLIESFNDACAGLMAPGRRTLIVMVRDLIVLRDESLNRFLASLQAYQSAGHQVFIESTPTWRKIVRGNAAVFESSAAVDSRKARRQVIICHSADRRAGAA